jgi:hypothetical protein
MAASRENDRGSTDVPGLAELVDLGVLLPATRRLSEVLAVHGPVKLPDSQAGSRVLDEHAVSVLEQPLVPASVANNCAKSWR